VGEKLLHTVKLLELLVHGSLSVELLGDGHVGATGDLGLLDGLGHLEGGIGCECASDERACLESEL